MRMSALLAFDTSTQQMSVGLMTGAQSWAHDAPGGAQASAQLLPTVMSMLHTAGIGLDQLDSIAFGRGPGAFTGLRTACAVAQGLALGAGKPVLGIDTLMAIAEDARQAAESLDVWVTLDARMDQLYVAQYLYANRRWKMLYAPALIDPEALNAIWMARPPQHVAGNGLSALAGRLRTGAAHCHAEAAPRASALLRLANSLWIDGAAMDAASALPTYLRDKVAQTITERAAARQTGEGAR